MAQSHQAGRRVFGRPCIRDGLEQETASDRKGSKNAAGQTLEPGGPRLPGLSEKGGEARKRERVEHSVEEHTAPPGHLDAPMVQIKLARRMRVRMLIMQPTSSAR